jgi:GT2 family glycosyltransferase
MFDIICSIVTYSEDPDRLKETIDSFYRTTLNVQLYIVDNSDNSKFSFLEKNYKNLIYLPNKKNLGYGSAHNVVLKSSVNKSKYNLVLNPDVVLNESTLENIFNYMEVNNDIGLLMPDIYYPDGERQYLCKQLPTAKELLLRRFFNRQCPVYEMRNMDYSKSFDVPYLSGCFMFVRNEVLKTVGFFDERFFMYMEDVDYSRRIGEKYRTVFYPGASIIHGYHRGSYKKMKLFYYHIVSAIKYFNKWGWISKF